MNLNFEKVKKFQEIYCKVSKSKNLDKKEFRLSLLEEEFNELKKAYSENCYKQILDAYSDMLFIIIGSLYYHGLQEDFEKYFDAVCDSNLTKHDKNLEGALITKEKYNNLGIETEYVQKSKDVYVTLRKSDGKILKSYNYKSPEEILGEKYVKELTLCS